MQDSFNPYKSSCTLKALCGLYLRRFLPRRAESSRPTWCGNTSPATMSWIDIVARKAIVIQQKPHPLRRDHGSGALHGIPLPFRTAKRQATSHQQQFLNHPLRKERSEWSKNKVLCQAFFQESLPPEASRPSNKALNRLRANEDVYGWEVGCCGGC